MSYWTVEELEQIAVRGFRELNVDLALAVIRKFANEAFGSPQLMQAISLNFCFERDINETQAAYRRIEIDGDILRRIFERTSARPTIRQCLMRSMQAPSKEASSASSSISLMERAATFIAAFSLR